MDFIVESGQHFDMGVPETLSRPKLTTKLFQFFLVWAMIRGSPNNRQHSNNEEQKDIHKNKQKIGMQTSFPQFPHSSIFVAALSQFLVVTRSKGIFFMFFPALIFLASLVDKEAVGNPITHADFLRSNSKS
jgi:hypothetical protein